MHAGFPGTWRWRTTFLAPDRYAWTIYTAGEPDHYLFDGGTARAFAGGRQVAVDADPNTPLRTHARFTAMANLDGLLLPGLRADPLPAADLPSGAATGVVAVFPDDGAQYRLGFDADLMLVSLSGPIALPPFGQGALSATFGDFRRVLGYWVPFATTYRFHDEPLADERALAVCPADPRVRPDAFRTPAALPDCATGGS